MSQKFLLLAEIFLDHSSRFEKGHNQPPSPHNIRVKQFSSLQVLPQLRVGSGHDLTLGFEWRDGKYLDLDVIMNATAENNTSLDLLDP